MPEGVVVNRKGCSPLKSSPQLYTDRGVVRNLYPDI